MCTIVVCPRCMLDIRHATLLPTFVTWCLIRVPQMVCSVVPRWLLVVVRILLVTRCLIDIPGIACRIAPRVTSMLAHTCWRVFTWIIIVLCVPHINFATWCLILVQHGIMIMHSIRDRTNQSNNVRFHHTGEIRDSCALCTCIWDGTGRSRTVSRDRGRTVDGQIRIIMDFPRCIIRYLIIRHASLWWDIILDFGCIRHASVWWDIIGYL